MSITNVATTTNSGTSATASCNKPAGVQIGDILIWVIRGNSGPAQWPGGGELQVPTGWVKLSSHGVATFVFGRIAGEIDGLSGGSEPSSYSLPWGSSVSWTTAITAFRDVNPGCPAVGNYTYQSGAANTLVCPSITSAWSDNDLRQAGDVMLTIVDFTTQTATPPGGQTQLFNLNPNNFGVAGAWETLTTADSGTRTWSFSANLSGGNYGLSFLIRKSRVASSLEFRARDWGKVPFAIPAATSSIGVDARGAAGKSSGGAVAAGAGARVQATLAVTAGETIYVGTGSFRSGHGLTAPPYQSWGGYPHPASGGGVAEIRQGGVALSNQVIVAAGGGGTSGYNYGDGTDGVGGAGGTTTGGTGAAGGVGSNPCDPNGNGKGGTGGTSSAGGTGGAATPGTPAGVAGGRATGGVNTYSYYSGGCGGAGYYGGGAGSAGWSVPGGYSGGGCGSYHGAGGGGSSFAGTGTSGVTHTQGYNTSTDGLIILSGLPGVTAVERAGGAAPQVVAPSGVLALPGGE